MTTLRPAAITTTVLARVVSSGIVAPGIHAQPAVHARFETVAALAEAKMREYHVPGVALGILENGSVTMRGVPNRW